MTVLHTLTIIILLRSICCEHQELKLISELNKFFKFDHNIILFDKSVDPNRFIGTKGRVEFTPMSLFSFKNINGNITGMYDLRKVISKNTFMIVSPDSSNFERNYNLLNRIKKIQRLQIRMKIGLLFQEVASNQDLEKIFEWSWTNRIITIFAATYLPNTENQLTSLVGALNIFTYNPFGTLKLINVTGSHSFDNFFLRQNCNFQQHPLRVLRYRSDYFWPIAFRAMNASYTEISYNKTTMSEVYENQHDVSLGVTVSISPPYLITIVKYSKGVIVVPEASPYGEFSAYLEAMTKDTFFVYSLILIIGVMMLLSIIRYRIRKRISFFESAADVLNLLMNDNSSIKYRKLNRSEFFIIIPLTFVGLVIVNGILSYLQSYLTQPHLQPQIHTVEDLYRSPLPILTQSEYQKNFTAYSLSIVSKHKDWIDKILIDEQFLSKAETFNRSLIFAAQLETANKLLRVQKKLGIKGYHIAETHITSYFNSYIVHNAFPFVDRLNDIIRRLQCAGLYDEWTRRENQKSDKDFIQKKIGSIKSSNVDNIESFPIPMFIFYGWIAGIIMLTIEIIWKFFIT